MMPDQGQMQTPALYPIAVVITDRPFREVWPEGGRFEHTFRLAARYAPGRSFSSALRCSCSIRISSYRHSRDEKVRQAAGRETGVLSGRLSHRQGWHLTDVVGVLSNGVRGKQGGLASSTAVCYNLRCHGLQRTNVCSACVEGVRSAGGVGGGDGIAAHLIAASSPTHPLKERREHVRQQLPEHACQFRYAMNGATKMPSENSSRLRSL